MIKPVVVAQKIKKIKPVNISSREKLLFYVGCLKLGLNRFEKQEFFIPFVVLLDINQLFVYILKSSLVHELNILVSSQCFNENNDQ